MLYKLNLPKPTIELETIAMDIAKSYTINYDSIEWHKKIQKENTNIVFGIFKNRDDLITQTRSEYQKFFTHKIYPTIGLLENINKNDSHTGCYPPHSDRLRHVVLNYYVELGGENVVTTFYDKYDDPTDKVGGYVVKYGDLNIMNQYITKKGTWYNFNSRQYHSVENIEDRRIILSIAVDTDFLTFYNSYKNIYNLSETENKVICGASEGT